MDLKDGWGSERRGAAAGAAPLSRQGSIYSLTFDEFQSTLGGMGGGLGKDFGSMNMDELLRSIWTAEESQAMASASGAGVAGGGAAAEGELQRQGSLTLPRTLSVKTVDEVWRDFARAASPGAAGGGELQPRRQPTLGEMTLEEFLVRAGVVRENPAEAAVMVAAAAAPPVAPRPIQAVNNSSIFFGNFEGANEAAGAGAIRFAPVGIGDPTMGNVLMSGVAGMGGGAVTVAPVDTSVGQLDSVVKGDGDLSSPMAPVPYPFEGVIRGRRSGGNVEKVVERRQRRMIKNRESAARSRARKQAYTMELEAEVQKLKEQNKELQKKQDEMMEMQKKQCYSGKRVFEQKLPNIIPGPRSGQHSIWAKEALPKKNIDRSLIASSPQLALELLQFADAAVYLFWKWKIGVIYDNEGEAYDWTHHVL
ncbi:hypothetical protein ABZP36_026610 [Zizania latifolia]